MRDAEHERRRIREYMELEAEGETVTHLEKVASERVFGDKHDVWDVQTDEARWWVITAPTNLYSQDEFRSMDYALSFHLGLWMRMSARREPDVSDERRDRLSGAWRRWTQAAEALDRADEAEEFQAVGMRCRETLLAFSREVASDEMVPSGQDAPKRSDFMHWSELVADFIAKGSSNDRIRAYLKSAAKTTWELVSWLTHAANASRFDGEFAVDATHGVLSAYSLVLVRYERGAPERCPRCSSYRLTSDFRPELNIEPPYVTLCESCGWEDLRTDEISDGVHEQR